MAALAAGCGTSSAELIVSYDSPPAWPEAYEAPGDGLGALVPVDVMAYDSETGEPLPNVKVTVWVEDDTLWPVPSEALVIVDPDECPDCEPWWDAQRDEFIEELPYRASLSRYTDEDGLVSLYVFVDAFPGPDADYGNFEDLAVSVSMGTVEETFVLTPR